MFLYSGLYFVNLCGFLYIPLPFFVRSLFVVLFVLSSCQVQFCFPSLWLKSVIQVFWMATLFLHSWYVYLSKYFGAASVCSSSFKPVFWVLQLYITCYICFLELKHFEITIKSTNSVCSVNILHYYNKNMSILL